MPSFRHTGSTRTIHGRGACRPMRADHASSCPGREVAGRAVTVRSLAGADTPVRGCPLAVPIRPRASAISRLESGRIIRASAVYFRDRSHQMCDKPSAESCGTRPDTLRERPNSSGDDGSHRSSIGCRGCTGPRRFQCPPARSGKNRTLLPSGVSIGPGRNGVLPCAITRAAGRPLVRPAPRAAQARDTQWRRSPA